MPSSDFKQNSACGEVDGPRRSWMAFAAMALAASSLIKAGEVAAQGSGKPNAVPPEAFTRDRVRQVRAGALDVGYVEMGPVGGRCTILLHGWPYDIHSYEVVAPRLVEAGFRVLVPYLRGHGTTRFLSSSTMRNAQQYVLADDLLAFMDAMGVERAVLAGYDWGGRIANIVAALHPERCTALVSGSGYLIGSQAAGRSPLTPRAELQWWYQYYFATARGEAGYAERTREFARLIWELASPKWHFDDALFDRCATTFDNPDHVAITIHNYRWRLGLADGERHYDQMEATLANGRGRRQRRAASRTRKLRRKVRRPLRTPNFYRRRRPQPAARTADRVRQGDRRRRIALRTCVARAIST